MEKKLLAFAVSLPTLLLVAGCGGGQGSAASGPGPLHTSTVGEAKVTYFGKVTPALSLSSSNVTVAGLSGAAFSEIDFYPQKELSNTSLVFSRGSQTWTYANGIQTEITNTLRQCLAGRWSHDGRIVYIGEDAASTAQLFICYADGSHLIQITSGATQYSIPAWSPDNTQLAAAQIPSGQTTTANIVTMSPTGTGVKVIVSDIVPLGPLTWTPDGMSIIYGATVAGVDQIYKVPAAGGSPVNITPAAYSADSCAVPAISPDGTTLGFIATISSVQTAILLDLATGTNKVFTPTGFEDSSISFSPDGSTIATTRAPTGSGTGGIYESAFDGDHATLVVPDPVDQAGNADTASFVNWSPFEGYRRFIGSSGALGSTASGFLFSQLQDGFAGFISFTATTPSSVVVTPAAPSGATTPLVFSVAADSITRVVYSDGYYEPGTSISPSTTTNLIISFSAITGQITTVAPLAVTKGGVTPKAVAAGPNLAYDGVFSAVYDAHGKNLALRGAKHIEINAKTGALATWN